MWLKMRLKPSPVSLLFIAIFLICITGQILQTDEQNIREINTSEVQNLRNDALLSEVPNVGRPISFSSPILILILLIGYWISID
jgi:hypothetical protein